MKIIHTSDWHFGKKLEGIKRIEEQKKFIETFVKIIEHESPKIILIAGDIFDTVNPSAEAETLFYQSIKKISKDGNRAVIIIPGNHDNSERLAASASLAKEFGIIIYEKPFEIKEIGKYGNFEIIASDKGSITIEIHGEKIYIYSLPYPSPTALNISFEEVNYSEKIGEILSEGIKNKPLNIPGIILTHLFVTGSSGDGDERNIELGGSLGVQLNDLPDIDYIALGHIHRSMKFEKKRAYYSGSPIEYRSSENKYEKKVFVAELKGNLKTEVKEIILENYKPIKSYTVLNGEEAVELSQKLIQNEEWIYLTIRTNRYLTGEEIRKIKENKNIVQIIPEFESTLESTIKVSKNHLDYSKMDSKPLFIDFYKNDDGVEPNKELVELFLKMVGDE